MAEGGRYTEDWIGWHCTSNTGKPKNIKRYEVFTPRDAVEKAVLPPTVVTDHTGAVPGVGQGRSALYLGQNTTADERKNTFQTLRKTEHEEGLENRLVVRLVKAHVPSAIRKQMKIKSRSTTEGNKNKKHLAKTGRKKVKKTSVRCIS